MLHSCKSLFDNFSRIGRLSGIPRRVPGAARALCLINDIDSEALRQEIRRPSGAAIWFIQPVLQIECQSCIFKADERDIGGYGSHTVPV